MAVKVTDEPAQDGLLPLVIAILTAGVTGIVTVGVTVFDDAVPDVTQPPVTVITA